MIEWRTHEPENMAGEKPTSYTTCYSNFVSVDIKQENSGLYKAYIDIRLNRSQRQIKYETTERLVNDLINDVMFYLIIHTTLEEVTEFEKKEILKQRRFK